MWNKLPCDTSASETQSKPSTPLCLARFTELISFCFESSFLFTTHVAACIRDDVIFWTPPGCFNNLHSLIVCDNVILRFAD